MIPFGNSTIAYDVENQGSVKKDSSSRYLEDIATFAFKYDFENPIYAREGLLSKLVKKIRSYKQR